MYGGCELNPDGTVTVKKRNLAYIQFGNLLKYGDSLKHCFTTRLGGVSEGEYFSLNLGVKKDDRRENVVKNFRIICEALGINPENLVFSDQVHGTEIRVVDEKDRGKGLYRDSDINCVDGLATICADVALVTFYADCVPVFLFDPARKAIAVVHSGWRGTLAEITAKAIDVMRCEFGCKPCNLVAAIGPSINRCCYEVGNEIYEQFRNALSWSEGFFENVNGKWHLSLQGIVHKTLLNKGLSDNNITVSKLCTRCRGDLFFSHRAGRGRNGLMAAIMQLTGR